MVQRLFERGDGQDAARLHRFHQFLSECPTVYSDYSGLAGEYEFLSQMEAAWKAFVVRLDPTLETSTAGKFRHVRACDFGKVQQQVLLHISKLEQESGNRMCVMSDILDRLHPAARQQVEAMMPAVSADVESAAEAYAAIQKWLMANRFWIFTDLPKSWCIVHQQECLLFPGTREDDVSDLTEEDVEEQPGPCCKRQKMQEPSGIHINFAGNTCKGWSSVGSNRRFGDKSELVHAVWLSERARRGERGGEHLFISECTVRYPCED